MIAHNSNGPFRQYLDELDRNGELLRVSKSVKLDCEIAEITRAEQHGSISRRALLFESIDGHPGARVATNLFGTIGRIARAAGLPKNTTIAELSRHVRSAFMRPVPPAITQIWEQPRTIFEAGSLDLTKLAVPRWSDKDAGPYIGTWHIVATRDPSSGVHNVGVYRMQVTGPSSTTLSVSPQSHCARHLDAAKSLGRRLEVAVAIGIDERIMIAAAAALPQGIDEYAAAGGLRGSSIPLIKCRTIDLEVPAESEFVLEGTVDPCVRVPDGPFYDYAGVPDFSPNAFRFDISCMHVRNDQPIFRGSAIGLPGAEDLVLYAVLARAGLMDFHGPKIKSSLQGFLCARQWFKLVQFSGRLGTYKRLWKKH